MRQMTRASVGDMGDGRHFSASVDYDEPGPFSFMLGPDFVEAREALAWARPHARRVTIRVGEVFYTAGDEPVQNLPEWEDVGPEPAGARGERGAPVAWQVEAHVNCIRRDGIDVAARLADALRAEPGTSEVTPVSYTHLTLPTTPYV